MSDKRATKSGVEGIVEDVAGVDFKFPRTLWSTVRHPVEVARAGMAGDRSRYTTPLRVFLVLFGLQVAVMGFFKLLEAQAPSSILPPEALALFEESLKDGVTLAEADEEYVRWYNIFVLPATVIASLPFIALFKAFNSDIKWSSQAVIYLVSVNASYIFALAFVPLYFLGMNFAIVASFISLIAWLAYLFPLIRGFLAKTTGGAVLKMTLAGLLVPPTLIIMVAVLLSTLEIVLHLSVGAGPFTALVEAS